MLYPLNILSTFILVLIIGLIFWALKRGATGLKVMILGIDITLIGGIIVLDTNFNLIDGKYLIVLLGLIITIIGFAFEHKD